MVVRREKKVRKYRGSRTHGWGKKGQHRDRGSQGKRAVGQHKEKWSWVVKYARDWYGKHGFHNPTTKQINAITIRKLNDMIIAGQIQVKEENGRKVVDLNEYDIDKLIGRGKPVMPLVIKVKSASMGAQEAVKGVGGEIVLTPGA
ncbi:MAG: uL15 family ribosomal protein [Sulfolobaceae archaeon]|jgi:LSU ribosomal protein L15P|nr:50S ribosomal protein L15 [Sulfolobales archaeon]